MEPVGATGAATPEELADEAYSQSMLKSVAQLDAGEGRELHAAMDRIQAKLLALQAAGEGASGK